jgi:hypothetical protein
MPKRQRGGLQDVGRRGGLTLTSQDVEHDIGGMNLVTERFGAGGFDAYAGIRSAVSRVG